jgi:hypothetical protein
VVAARVRSAQSRRALNLRREVVSRALKAGVTSHSMELPDTDSLCTRPPRPAARPSGRLECGR